MRRYSFSRALATLRAARLLNASSKITVDKEVGQAAATFNATNAQKMVGPLHAPSMERATWIMKPGRVPARHRVQVLGGLPPGRLERAATATGGVVGRRAQASGAWGFRRARRWRVLFNGWGSMGRVVLAGVAAYALLVVMLRLSGKRTLSKLNAFDLVVTVALGSTLSSVILDRSVALTDGLAALALLIGLQYAVAWAATRSRRFDRIVKSEPRVLYHRGTFARDAMRDERITEDAVLAAIRSARVDDLDSVDAVVLESSGDLSVLQRAPGDPTRHATLPQNSASVSRTPGDHPSRS